MLPTLLVRLTLLIVLFHLKEFVDQAIKLDPNLRRAVNEAYVSICSNSRRFAPTIFSFFAIILIVLFSLSCFTEDVWSRRPQSSLSHISCLLLWTHSRQSFLMVVDFILKRLSCVFHHVDSANVNYSILWYATGLVFSRNSTPILRIILLSVEETTRRTKKSEKKEERRKNNSSAWAPPKYADIPTILYRSFNLTRACIQSNRTHFIFSIEACTFLAWNTCWNHFRRRALFGNLFKQHHWRNRRTTASCGSLSGKGKAPQCRTVNTSQTFGKAYRLRWISKNAVKLKCDNEAEKELRM